VSTEKEKTYVQCTNCGHIHIVERKIPINISVVKSECPKCEWPKGLNCGNKEEDYKNCVREYARLKAKERD
jgi:hypothetical protein